MYIESRLLTKWKRAAADLGISVVAPFDVALPSGAHVHAPLLVRNFGAREGMLIISDPSHIRGLEQQVVQAGYGFSIMSEPREGEEYLRDVFVQVLTDWGWAGRGQDRPAWMGPGIPD